MVLWMRLNFWTSGWYPGIFDYNSPNSRQRSSPERSVTWSANFDDCISAFSTPRISQFSSFWSPVESYSKTIRQKIGRNGRDRVRSRVYNIPIFINGCFVSSSEILISTGTSKRDSIINLVKSRFFIISRTPYSEMVFKLIFQASFLIGWLLVFWLAESAIPRSSIWKLA